MYLLEYCNCNAFLKIYFLWHSIWFVQQLKPMGNLFASHLRFERTRNYFHMQFSSSDFEWKSSFEKWNSTTLKRFSLSFRCIRCVCVCVCAFCFGPRFYHEFFIYFVTEIPLRCCWIKYRVRKTWCVLVLRCTLNVVAVQPVDPSCRPKNRCMGKIFALFCERHNEKRNEIFRWSELTRIAKRRN